MLTLKSEFRKWIIQERVGLLTKAELVQLADNYIAEHEAFPDWVIKISLGESLDRESLLDLILEPINEADCKVVANELLSLYQNNRIDIQILGEVSRRLYLSIEWGGEAFNRFIWISDEVDLITQGAKSRCDLDTNLEKILGEVIAL